MKVKAFENVKGQIGFCGIWCGSCVVGNGALIELTKRFEGVVQKYSLEKWVAEDLNFKEFKKRLASIQNISLCPGCLKGGGREGCEIINCASNKKNAGCSECDEPIACKNFEKLKKMRDGAYDEGLFVKIENVDREKLFQKRTDELKGIFPHCILLCNVKQLCFSYDLQENFDPVEAR